MALIAGDGNANEASDSRVAERKGRASWTRLSHDFHTDIFPNPDIFLRASEGNNVVEIVSIDPFRYDGAEATSLRATMSGKSWVRALAISSLSIPPFQTRRPLAVSYVTLVSRLKCTFKTRQIPVLYFFGKHVSCSCMCFDECFANHKPRPVSVLLSPGRRGNNCECPPTKFNLENAAY